ncbi:hypothetical protein [Brevundimonas sp.]|uniref:hypothetical protein n=1 Tax=Brevundimonas sp. TaxID=1871086 RepID=UPI0028B23A7C|nr:hypothetical protein [Brevundimonas sp.]
MFNVGKAISRNNATFYDFGSNKRVRIYPRIVASAIVAALISVSTQGPLNDLLAGTITVQAILIGFGFSVMFFLASGYNTEEKAKRNSIEDEIKEERLLKLSKEIFYNISYFNLVAMTSLAFAILLLLPSAKDAFTSVLSLAGATNAPALMKIYNISNAILYFSIVACFYFTTIESGYTFGRMVGRVGYLFEQKIQN